MNISVFIEKENKTKILKVEGRFNVKDILGKLNINPVTVLVARNDELLLEDDLIEEGDELKIISVISGG